MAFVVPLLPYQRQRHHQHIQNALHVATLRITAFHQECNRAIFVPLFLSYTLATILMCAQDDSLKFPLILSFQTSNKMREWPSTLAYVLNYVENGDGVLLCFQILVELLVCFPE